MNDSLQNITTRIKDAWRFATRFFGANIVVGGLEISDQALRYAAWTGTQWLLFGVRLPAGILEAGYIKDKEAFVSALKTLHSQIRRKEDKKVLPVAVSFSSASIYSQTFQLPYIQDKDLDSAVSLNLQMISPTDIGQVYSGWEVARRDEGASVIEIFGAFLSKILMDDLSAALTEAGFLPITVESKSLSLVRLVREWGVGIDMRKAYVLLQLDSSGINFVIMRFGKMAFEYFLPWKDINALAGKQIAMADFESALIRSLNQVVNFYSQHWNDVPVEDCMIIAPGFESQIQQILKANFALNPHALKLKGAATLSGRWMIALGAGLRGMMSRRKDADLTVLGITPQGEYAREIAGTFFSFWRIAVPVSLSLLLVMMWGASFFLQRIKGNLEQLIGGVSAQMEEISRKEGEAKDFNALVQTIYSTQQEGKPKSIPMDKIVQSASSANIRLSRVSINVSGESNVSGEAQTQDQVRTFKKLLEDTPSVFSQVQLPLSSVKSGPDGVTFSMSLRVSLAAASNTP